MLLFLSLQMNKFPQGHGQNAYYYYLTVQGRVTGERILSYFSIQRGVVQYLVI